jgi:hypothetical protein
VDFRFAILLMMYLHQKEKDIEALRRPMRSNWRQIKIKGDGQLYGAGEE